MNVSAWAAPGMALSVVEISSERFEIVESIVD